MPWNCSYTEPDTAETRQYHCFADAMETPRQQLHCNEPRLHSGGGGREKIEKKNLKGGTEKLQYALGAQSLFQQGA